MSGLISLLRVFLSPFWVKEAEKKEKPVSAPCRLLMKPRKDLCSQCVPSQEVTSLAQKGLPLSGFPENRTCLCSGCLSWPPQQTIQLPAMSSCRLPLLSQGTSGRGKETAHTLPGSSLVVSYLLSHSLPQVMLITCWVKFNRRKCIPLVSWWEQLVPTRQVHPTFKRSCKWRRPKSTHLSSEPWKEGIYNLR